MGALPRFEAAGPALLRIPTARVADGDRTRSGADETALLLDVLDDPLFREAVEVSSDSLAGTLRRIEEKYAVEPPKVRRAAFAAARYLLRMSGRPTPFGLFAGVTVAKFGDRATVSLGDRHTKGVRPDLGWLALLLSEWERHPTIRRRLRVVANDLCVRRGDRLVLPYVRSRTDTGPSLDAREVSIRFSQPVELVLGLANRPVPYTRLVDDVRAAFPSAAVDVVEAMLDQLVEREVLLTDLRPPSTVSDPLGYVLDRVGDVPEVAVLREVADRLAAYAARRPGHGRSQWRRAVETMSALRAVDRPPIHVDLRFDADVTLPRAVADEAAAAATALLRLSPADTPAHLREYHDAFVDRYGLDGLVPLTELIDPERGLDAPAGYLTPPSGRRSEPGTDPLSDRDRRLADLALRALTDGSNEVVLDDALIEQLADPADRPPPRTAELCAELFAGSVAALDAGDFRLVVSPIVGSPAAGSIFGRFAYLFPQMTLRANRTTDDGPVRAQLTFTPVSSRAGNVAQVPMLHDHLLSVGAFAERDDPGVLGAEDLVVGASSDHLMLFSARDGREVVAASPSMLNMSHLAPNAVRLVYEFAQTRWQSFGGWSWGGVRLLPRLPRVRYGRTVLAPAEWRVDPELLSPRLSSADWDKRLDTWRVRGCVPDRIRVTAGDNRVDLDLGVPLHRRLFRHELARRPHTRVQEAVGDGAGWLGGHAGELVTPLTVRDAHRPVPTPRVPLTVAAPRHLPGGEWLYAKLYSSRVRQDELLAGPVANLVARLPPSVDRWFFIRYADPEPHLRLRFHTRRGEHPTDIRAEPLARIHDWAAELITDGLAGRLLLDTYEPEVSRYGGPEAIDAAESAFAADSDAVLAQLRLREQGLDLDPAVLAAANYVDLLDALGPDDWQRWLVDTHPRDEAAHAAFRRDSRETLRLITPGGDWAALAARPGGVDLLDVWRRRRPAVAAYGELVRRNPALSGVRGALLHMHHNRLVGIDRAREARAMAVARGVVAARLTRARALR